MYGYIFILVIFLTLHVVVNGSVTICIPRNDDGNNSGDYYGLVKRMKKELTVLLEEETIMHFDHLEFDFQHPAISAKGEINDVTVENLDKFDLEFFKDIDIITKQVEIFNLTFSNISVVGEYDMTGNIGDLFDIWGTGHFWANTLNFSVSATSRFTAINISLDVNTALQELKSWFENMMDDDELEDIINNAFMDMAPEVIEVFWGEFKDAVDGPLQNWIDSIINEHGTDIAKHVLMKTQDII